MRSRVGLVKNAYEGAEEVKMPFKIFSLKTKSEGAAEVEMNNWERENPSFITHLAVGETAIVIAYQKTEEGPNDES